MRDQDAKQYHKIHNLFFYVTLGLDVALLVFFQASGLSIGLREWAFSINPSPFLANLIYFQIFVLLAYLVHFPFSFFLGFVWEHRFQLSNQTFGAWYKDHLKENVLSGALFVVLATVIYLLLARFPGTWWIAAGLVWLFVSLFMARILPTMIIPLFYKYLPIENVELKKQILDLFTACRIAVQDVYAINMSAKTKKANAFICGIGKNRRVVLSDTLLDHFSVPEITAVVAHELGHHKNRDISRMITVNAATVLLGFYLADAGLKFFLARMGNLSIDDVAAFPTFALILTLFGFVTMPLLNAYSRLIEVKADRFSLQMTGSPVDFISMMKKLGELNLAEYNPSRFNEIMFYDHPPLAKRIKLAEQFSSS